MASTMDWTLAIRRNRQALMAVVASLETMTGGGLPRLVALAILAILRPAESAARRLIVILAAGLQTRAIPVAPRQGPDFAQLRRLAPAAKAAAFPLFDRRKRFGFKGPVAVRVPPRISLPGFFNPVFVPPKAPSEPEAASVLARLARLRRVLDRLPAEARRLNRILKRQGQGGTKRLAPLRMGFPPGWRQHHRREIDAILRECHALAHHRAAPP